VANGVQIDYDGRRERKPAIIDAQGRAAIRGTVMQRASIIVLIVGVLIGLAIAQAAAGATIDHIALAPPQPPAGRPVQLDLQITLPSAGFELFTAPPTSDSPGVHRLDVVYWRDSLNFYPQVLTPAAALIDLGGFTAGTHTLTVYLHTLTAPVAERDALLTSPSTYTGPSGDPFADFNTTARQLQFQIDDTAAATPEPTTAVLLLVGAIASARRRKITYYRA
jgi:hypothetical protein